MSEFYDVFQELIKQEDYVLGIKVLGPSIVPYPPDRATPSRCACSGTELASPCRDPVRMDWDASNFRTDEAAGFGITRDVA